MPFETDRSTLWVWPAPLPAAFGIAIIEPARPGCIVITSRGTFGACTPATAVRTRPVMWISNSGSVSTFVGSSWSWPSTLTR